MDIETIFGPRRSEISGSGTDTGALSTVQATLPAAVAADGAFDPWRELPIVGVCFYIEEDDDPTGMGVEFRWMSVSQLETEALKAQPGLSFAPLGFLPIGMCLLGSGDPYFLDLRQGTDNPPIVRIPHEAGMSPNADAVELVNAKLSDFVAQADIES